MKSTFVLLAIVATAFATPLTSRADKAVNANAVTGTTCGTDKIQVQHDVNVALLQICGGIAGKIEKCGGNPTSTTGASKSATFSLTPANKGATINVSKGRWEGCIRAAQAACPGTGFTSTCVGGTSSGNLNFSLKNA